MRYEINKELKRIRVFSEEDRHKMHAELSTLAAKRAAMQHLADQGIQNPIMSGVNIVHINVKTNEKITDLKQESVPCLEIMYSVSGSNMKGI